MKENLKKEVKKGKKKEKIENNLPLLKILKTQSKLVWSILIQNVWRDKWGEVYIKKFTIN